MKSKHLDQSIYSLFYYCYLPKIRYKTTYWKKTKYIIASRSNIYFKFSCKCLDKFYQSIFKLQEWKTRGKYYSKKSFTRVNNNNNLTVPYGLWNRNNGVDVMLIFKDTCHIIKRLSFSSRKKFVVSRVSMIKSSKDDECLKNRK